MSINVETYKTIELCGSNFYRNFLRFSCDSPSFFNVFDSLAQRISGQGNQNDEVKHVCLRKKILSPFLV